MIVIDASIGLKWFQEGEEDRTIALRLYENHRISREQIMVPNLFNLELTNALVTKSHTTQAYITESLAFLFRAELSVYKENQQDIISTAELAKKYKTSVYDMLYAVIARKHKTILVTADERFVKVTKFLHVKLLSEYKI